LSIVRLYTRTYVYHNARLYTRTYVYHNARLYTCIYVYHNARLYTRTYVYHNARFNKHKLQDEIKRNAELGCAVGDRLRNVGTTDYVYICTAPSLGELPLC
jgi:hypothetical protein